MDFISVFSRLNLGFFIYILFVIFFKLISVLFLIDPTELFDLFEPIKYNFLLLNNLPNSSSNKSVSLY